MNHLSEEQLVEHFYRESATDAETHLKNCAQCAQALAVLQEDLAGMKVAEPPMRDIAYGDRVWQSIAPRLPVYEGNKANRESRPPSWLNLGWMHTGLGRGLSYAAACCLLLTGSFFAGRMWEHRKQPQIVAAPRPVQPAVKQPAQRVVVIVLGDHLDRSERLLVELKHADADSAETIAPLRDEARTLLAANRTFRQRASQMDDPELATALKHLDAVLGVLANHPGGLNPQAIAKLQDEMKSDRLLFEVRVLRARTPERQIRGTLQANGGTI